MATAAGDQEAIPSLPEYPSQAFISKLPPQEWQACLDIWIWGVELRLRLSKDEFSRKPRHTSDVSFLLSYFRSTVEGTASPSQADNTQDGKLWKNCLLLLRRLCLESSLIFILSPDQTYQLFIYANEAFPRHPWWTQTIHLCFQRAPKELKAACEAGLRSIDQSLFSNTSQSFSTLIELRQATSLIGVAPEVGINFMTGTDYLETLTEHYDGAIRHPHAEKLETCIVEHTFVCLRSLMDHSNLKISVLIDHLYSLKASADRSRQRNPNRSTLLSSLVCLTTLLRHLSMILDPKMHPRGEKILRLLQEHRETTLHLHTQRLVRASADSKGKRKAGTNPKMHMHRASQVSQIHDLFPDLPIGYILRLLDHYSDSTETVIGALLEPDSIPIGLRNSSTDDDATMEAEFSVPDLVPKSTPPLLAQRKNVFDNDDFDNLKISPSKLHKGKNTLLDVAVSSDEQSKRKAAIMAALSAFDSDDDERDDSYDFNDVGGAVDNTVDNDEKRPRQKDDPNERLLFTVWKETREHFARDSKTRLSQHRRQLKADTGWSDEQIEGWGLMLSRDSARENRLAQKYNSAASFGGIQNQIQREKWTANGSGTATEEEDSDIDPKAASSGGFVSIGGQSLGASETRGARAGGIGRGRATTGDPSDENIQRARRRKEQGRGRGGPSHNRREGRAKKMNRGMAGAVAS